MRFLGNIIWLVLGGLVIALIYEPGCLSVTMNLIWILLGWWEIAFLHLACGILFCITIVGIPWGLRHFSMALSSVFPFGKEIRPVNG